MSQSFSMSLSDVIDKNYVLEASLMKVGQCPLPGILRYYQARDQAAGPQTPPCEAGIPTKIIGRVFTNWVDFTNVSQMPPPGHLQLGLGLLSESPGDCPLGEDNCQEPNGEFNGPMEDHEGKCVAIKARAEIKGVANSTDGRMSVSIHMPKRTRKAFREYNLEAQLSVGRWNYPWAELENLGQTGPIYILEHGAFFGIEQGTDVLFSLRFTKKAKGGEKDSNTPTAAVKDLSHLCDFHIRTVSQTFDCLRVKLAEKSEVFNNMFKSGFKETTESVMEIDNYDDETIASFLQFVNEGRVEDKAQLTTELFKMAHQYEVTDLMTETYEELSKEITEDSYVELFGLAVIYNINSLKLKIYMYLQENWTEMKDDEGVKGLMKSSAFAEGMINFLMFHAKQSGQLLE